MKRAITTALLLSILVAASAATCSMPDVRTLPTATATPTPSRPLDEPSYGGTVIISHGAGTPRHFNPALVSGSATAIVGVQIFASPLRYDENWNPQPYLARRWQVSEEGGLFPQWRSDGREIVYTKQNGELVAAEVAIGADSLQPSGTRVLFRIHPPRPEGTSFALAPDGEKLLVWSNKQRDSETVVNLIVNWPAELD